MIDNSYYIILNRLKAFANGHYLINTFTYQDESDFDISKNPHYPIMHPIPVSFNPKQGGITYNFDIVFADKPRQKENAAENKMNIISDMTRCALDLGAEITNGNILFGSDVTLDGDISIEPFTDDFANVLTGVRLQIAILIPYDWSACDIPANWVDGTGDIPDFGGRSLTMDIYDEGNFVVAAREMNFVGSGVTVTYTGNRAIVTITGGGGGGGLTCDDLADCDTIKTIQQSVIDAEAGANTYTDNQINALTAADVGADAAGSAATALTSANSYTDTQINALDADDIEETATRFWLTSILKTAYDAAVTWIATNGTNILNHLSNTSNPHNVTASQVGLGNVDNTSDANKPISTATQTALDLKADISQLPLIYKSTTDSSAVTGTTGATLIRAVLIPANTFAVGDVIRVRQRIRKTGANGVFTAGIYINTSAAFAGSSQLAVYTTTAITHLTLGMKRDFFIKSGTVTEGMWSNVSLPTDDQFTTQNVTNTNINWAVDQYFVFTVNPNNASDSFIQSGYTIEKI